MKKSHAIFGYTQDELMPTPQKKGKGKGKGNCVWVNPTLPVVKLKPYNKKINYNNKDNIKPLEK